VAAPIRFAAGIVGTLVAPLHLLVANIVPPLNPGPYTSVSRSYDRAAISAMAREVGVRQRALLFALSIAAVKDISGGRRIRAIYSSVDGGAGGDSFMRMRQRFATFRPASDFVSFARSVDATLHHAERHESGFMAEMSARGIATHRRLSRLIPGAYSDRLFAYMPFDIILGLIPPHRLGGALEGFEEPIFAGAALSGANGCVIVPGRNRLTFNFYVQRPLAGRIRGLDMLIRNGSVI
jgi:hypothetical protein